ncbi:unnamed protein product [Gadus morhua 'NCC']
MKPCLQFRTPILLFCGCSLQRLRLRDHKLCSASCPLQRSAPLPAAVPVDPLSHDASDTGRSEPDHKDPLSHDASDTGRSEPDHKDPLSHDASDTGRSEPDHKDPLSHDASDTGRSEPDHKDPLSHDASDTGRFRSGTLSVNG